MGTLVVLIFVLSFTNIAELRPTNSFQNRSQFNFEFSPFEHTYEMCKLTLKDTFVIDKTNKYFDDGADLVVFNIEIIGYTKPDFDVGYVKNFNPLQWILTNSHAGKAMLFLPGPFIPMSLYTLSHGIHELVVILKQTPDNCLGRTKDTDTTTKVQELIGQTILRSFGSQNSKLSPDIEVCHINTSDGEIQYQCCTAEPDGLEVCEQVIASAKMVVLLAMINVLLLIVALYSPVLIPPSLYLWNIPETYTIQLPQDENGISFETNFKVDPDLKIDLQNLGKTAKGIKIQVNQDKVVSQDDTPVGLFSCLWHFCKTSESVTACTSAPLFPFCKTTYDDQKNSCCRISFRTIVSRCIRFLGSISPIIVIMSFNELTEQKQIVPFVDSNPVGPYYTLVLRIALGILILATLLSLRTPDIVKKRVITELLEDMKKSMTCGFSRYVSLVSSTFQKLGVCLAVVLLPITMILISPILLSMFPLLRFFYLNITGRCSSSARRSTSIMFYMTSVYLLTYYCLVFYANCIVYTLIGVVINADFYAQYVTFSTIIVLYGFNNFVKVSEVFTKFNKTLHAYTQKRFSYKLNFTEPGLNSAVVIKMEDKTILIKTDASGRLICYIPGLVLFRYSNGTQHISKRFLSQFTKDIHRQCPEKPHVLYGRAFINLMFITIFIMCVFLVVYAFGRSNGITSAGKLIIAVSGSILPILLRGVLFKIETEEKPETDSEKWKDAFNKVLENYKEFWVVDPITFENDTLEDDNENVPSTSRTSLNTESTHLLRDETIIN